MVFDQQCGGGNWAKSNHYDQVLVTKQGLGMDIKGHGNALSNNLIVY